MEIRTIINSWSKQSGGEQTIATNSFQKTRAAESSASEVDIFNFIIIFKVLLKKITLNIFYNNFYYIH